MNDRQPSGRETGGDPDRASWWTRVTAPGRTRTVTAITAVAVVVAVILGVTLSGGTSPTAQHRPEARPPGPTATTTSRPSSRTTTASVPSGSVASAPTTAAPPPVPSAGAYTSDDFARVVTGGWGTAPTGGPWSLVKGAASDVSVNGSAGVIAITAGSYLTVDHVLVLPATSVRDYAGSFDVSFMENINRVNPQYGGVLAYLVARFQNTGANGYYRLGVVWDAASRRLWLRTQNPAGKGHAGDFTIETNTGIDPTADFPGGAPYGPYHVKVRITGSGPTTFASKLWKAGTPEPGGWMLTGTDANNLGPQVAGPIGIRASDDLQGSPGSYLNFTAHVVIGHLAVGPATS